MLQPDIQDYSAVVSIQKILDDIDCTLTLYGKNGLDNKIYSLDRPYPKNKISLLIHYKRILFKRQYNGSYVCSHAIEKIIARVKSLGIQDSCKCDGLAQSFEFPTL
jgi:hypothetical protein